MNDTQTHGHLYTYNPGQSDTRALRHLGGHFDNLTLGHVDTLTLGHLRTFTLLYLDTGTREHLDTLTL